MSGVPDWLVPAMGGNTVISAALGYLIPAFVTRKKDAGELASDLLTQCMADIAELKADNKVCRSETTELRAICTRNDVVIRLVLPELQRVSPYSSALVQARDLLGAAFPISFDTPPDMTAKLCGLGLHPDEKEVL